MTSPGCSTTQITPASRRSSWQIRQVASVARLKQTSHCPTVALTSLIASASGSASSSLALRMWNASRCAVRCPIPGSRASSVMRRLTGGANKPLEARQAQTAEAALASEAAGGGAHLRRRQLLGGAHRLVDRRLHHVLEQLDVLRVD